MRAGTHTLSKKLTILLRYNIRATTETGKWATCKELATAAGAREELVEHIIINECKGTRPRFLYQCGGPSTPSLCQAYAKQAKGTVGHQWWPTTNGNNNDLDNDNEHNPSSKRSRTDATREHAAPWPSIPDSTTQCPTVWHTEYGYEDERASTKPDEKLFIKRIGNFGGEPHPVKVDSDDDNWGPGWGPKPSHWAPSPVVARQCCKAIRRTSSVKRYVGAKSKAQFNLFKAQALARLRWKIPKLLGTTAGLPPLPLLKPSSAPPLPRLKPSSAPPRPSSAEDAWPEWTPSPPPVPRPLPPPPRPLTPRPLSQAGSSSAVHPKPYLVPLPPSSVQHRAAPSAAPFPPELQFQSSANEERFRNARAAIRELRLKVRAIRELRLKSLPRWDDGECGA